MHTSSTSSLTDSASSAKRQRRMLITRARLYQTVDSLLQTSLHHSLHHTPVCCCVILSLLLIILPSLLSSLSLHSPLLISVAGVYSVVYYQSGAVKHGNTVITPDGCIHTTTSNTPPIPTRKPGNTPWTERNKVTVDVDMSTRTLSPKCTTTF